MSSSPKLRRNAHSRLESYRPDTELSREDTGCNLQHISDRENIDGKRLGGEANRRGSFGQGGMGTGAVGRSASPEKAAPPGLGRGRRLPPKAAAARALSVAGR